jgi:hypothetical protein
MVRNLSALRSFRVRGSGEFPFDMLRYDECWPAGADDAAAMNKTGRRLITLRVANHFAPTEARWNSFNWKIVPIPE